MLRVLVDTSVFISYLLNPVPDSFGTLLLDATAKRHIRLLITDLLLDEIENTVKRKPYLFDKIGAKRLTTFTSLLRAISENIPTIDEEIPAITRDRTDDFLVFYAVVGTADYLVSVDKDLLVLGKIQNVNIVHTAEFRQILQAHGSSST